MKFDTQKRLCLEGSEFIRTLQSPDGLVAKGTYDSLKSRGRIEVLERGGNGRSVMIVYESLPPLYKQLVWNKFGDPYAYTCKQPLLALVKKDPAAEQFFLSYRYDEHKSLPLQHVENYVTAAAWLTMLQKVQYEKGYIKKELGITKDIFWKTLLDMIITHNIPLPHSYKRLSEKLKLYQDKGLSCLIDWRFGNQNSAKIKDELSESMLLELISHPNQHDDTVIATAYNQWAHTHHYATITAATVGNYRRNNYYQLQLFREGNAAWYNQFGKQTKRFRPSAPLLLVGSDDNDVDLYFRDEKVNEKGQLSMQYYHRFKAVVISDAFNDYPLGFFYADNISTDLVKLAYLDAMHHIQQLTGDWYLPHQLQTDRWNLKALEPFYKSIDRHYFAAAARAPRSKYIERTFGKRWHQHLRRFDNYAGNNITSRFRLNPEHVAASRQHFPHKNEGFTALQTFVEGLRQEKDPRTGISRQDTWKAAFANSSAAQERRITEEQLLLLFGVPHAHTNTITNGGIRITINGQSYEYDVPNELYLQHVGKKVQAYYDPFDFSRVLITDGGPLRFVARTIEKLPAARADYQAGDETRLFRHLHHKKEQVKLIMDRKKQRETLLAAHQQDAAGLLQARVMQKEIQHAAVYASPPIADHPAAFDPLDLM
jgi:Mu transposase, C-terminal